jgi:hypothetical protein
MTSIAPLAAKRIWVLPWRSLPLGKNSVFSRFSWVSQSPASELKSFFISGVGCAFTSLDLSTCAGTLAVDASRTSKTR